MPEDVLCPECLQKQWPWSIGTCPQCGGFMLSCAYTHCLDCARRKQACQGCGKPCKNGPKVSER
jgi:hypothetical protein